LTVPGRPDRGAVAATPRRMPPPVASPGEDHLLRQVAALMAIPSPSHGEAALADHVERRLRLAPWLAVDRIGDNVVARTTGSGPRLILAGHLDTVPANGNAEPRLDGSILWGLGSADMKGGLAVMLELAGAVHAPAPTAAPAAGAGAAPAAAAPVPTAAPAAGAGAACPQLDVTWVFYAAEEVGREHNGLLAIERSRPDLLVGDAAILGEPTGAVVEAGCQGVVKLQLVLGGQRAHTARPWTGVNAIHRLGPVLDRLAAAPQRTPIVDGCRYREALQAVAVSGGVAGNVVPDEASLSINHRFAPDRDAAAAEASVRALLEPLLQPARGDRLTVSEVAPAAPPSLRHPLLAALLRATGAPPRAKLGWTDVAFFAERGIPAVNFGPGDPELAHSAGERVSGADLIAVHAALHALIIGGA
jgi:succinyl-diaminopimelate desuccinylase